MDESIGEVTVVQIGDGTLRNALTQDRKAHLYRAVSDAIEDSNCRVIVVTGTDTVFCAGGNMSSRQLVPGDELTNNMRSGHRVIELIANSPKPVVAAVDGPAYGSGLALAAICDFVVAGAAARFCAAFGKVGLAPDAGLTWSLPRRVGRARALELMLSCRVLDRDEAILSGMADLGAVEPARESAVAFARGLCTSAPLAVAGTKELLLASDGGLMDVLNAEIEVQNRLVQSQDFGEGRLAFQQRRNPEFRGC